MSLDLSSAQFGSDSLTGQSIQHHTDVESPLSYSSGTRTSVGQRTSWRSQPGASYSSQTKGSTLNFDDSSSSLKMPEPDRGASF